MMATGITLEHVAIDRTAVVDGHAQRMRILSDVNLTVPPGGRLALFGPSGAGKTSLLRLLNRLDDPAEGRVLLDGEDLRQLNPVAVRRRVGMVFQQPILFDMTVEENLAYPLSLQQKPLSREAAEGLLTEIGLPLEFLSRRGNQLSGGQQQRVAIMRALVLSPEVLLLDEPTSALDERSAEIAIDALLKRNREQGLTLVVITHTREILHRLDCPAVLVHEGHTHAYPDVETAVREADRERIQIE